jgi:anti-anti-sigma factor
MIETDQKSYSVRVTLDGDLGAAQVEELRRKLRPLIAEGYLTFTFDFAKSRFMCSAGLGLLVEVYNAVRTHDGRVCVENVPEAIGQLLRSTKLLDIFTAGDTSDGERALVLEAVQEHMSTELLFLSYLNDLSSSILQAEITEDIYDVALDGILKSLKSPRGMLLLLADGEGGRLFRVAASCGFDYGARSSVEDLLLLEGTFEALCLESKKAQVFSDSGEALPPSSRLLDASDCRRGILAPIVGRDTAHGLILIGATEEESAFFPHSTPVVEVFASVCGLAVEKQSLLEGIQHRNTQLATALYDLGKTQDSLMEAGKLAVIGAMMRGLAHALNNKLVPIMGYAQMLAADLGDNRQMAEKVNIIESSAEDIKGIVDQLRKMVVHETLNIETHDLRDVLDSTLAILDYLFQAHGILVRPEYGKTDGTIEMDRERMVQAFLALCHRLPAALMEQDNPTLHIAMEQREEQMVVRFTDNGHAIPDSDLRTILNPFEGFDTPYALDRLNFSIASGVLRDHRASMELTAGPENHGTCVTMRIPLLQKRRKSIVIQ